MMFSVPYDFEYLKAGISQLEVFLLSNKIFWPLSSPPPPGEPQFPRLTLGGLLLSGTRLSASHLKSFQIHELESLERQLDHWRVSWRTAWERKARREFLSRLRQWEIYLSELLHEPETHFPYYEKEVRVRVLIELLRKEMGPIKSEYKDKLSALDELLKANLVVGDFIWEWELKSGFGESEYWFLWGLPNFDQFNNY